MSATLRPPDPVGLGRREETRHRAARRLLLKEETRTRTGSRFVARSEADAIARAAFSTREHGAFASRASDPTSGRRGPQGNRREATRPRPHAVGTPPPDTRRSHQHGRRRSIRAHARPVRRSRRHPAKPWPHPVHRTRRLVRRRRQHPHPIRHSLRLRAFAPQLPSIRWYRPHRWPQCTRTPPASRASQTPLNAPSPRQAERHGQPLTTVPFRLAVEARSPGVREMLDVVARLADEPALPGRSSIHLTDGVCASAATR